MDEKIEKTVNKLKIKKAIRAERPTEMFQNKALEYLKKMKFPTIASRRTWPFEVLHRVYVELQESTPKDLLEKEFWCSSASPDEWWSKRTSFAKSVAVMSMIGVTFFVYLIFLLIFLSNSKKKKKIFKVCNWTWRSTFR